MIIISALFLTFYVGTVILLHLGFAPLRQFARLLREIAPEGRSTTPAPTVVIIPTGAIGATEKARVTVGEGQS